MKHRLPYAAAVIITLAAFLLRVPGLAAVPPGLFYDEAVNGLDILRILHGQQFPIFFEANAGREPLFIYAQSLAVLLLGDRIFSLRIVAAFAGVLTVPILFRLGAAFSAERKRSIGIALLTAAGLATCYWHLNWSRIGLRIILLPLFAALTLYLFWRARTGGRTRDWIAAGAFLGLSQYTYLAARFLPVVYLLFFVTELLDRPGRLWLWLRPRALLFLVALVIYAPLGLYFLSEPGAFIGRAQDVALNVSTDLASNLGRVAGMFFVRGDLEWRHNLAGRPALDWITVFPFLAGVVVALIRVRKPAVRLVWIWLLVMLLPSILSAGAPDFARAIGALPAVYILIAWGWNALLEVVGRLVPRVRSLALPAALGLALIGSGLITAQDYFGRWANAPQTLKDFESGMTDLADWLNRTPGPVYIPLELYAHPTVQFLTAPRFQIASFSRADATLVQAGGQVVAPDLKNTSGAFVLLGAGQAVLLNPTALPSVISNATVPARGGSVAAVGPVTGDAFGVLQPVQMVSMPARFENHLTLLGYNLKRVASRLDVTLYWQSEALQRHEARVFVHLLDDSGAVIAQADDPLTGGVSPLDWPLNQVMPDRHVLDLKDGVGTVHPRLEIGLIGLFDTDRINVALGDNSTDDHVIIGPVDLP
ncbi:MAG: glycosyltransferase family 39 protein [Anaerolineae bacterium]